MANLLSQSVLFEYQGDLAKKSPSQLESLGYYQGFPCAHGHTIRNKNTHACYECSYKITSNICGFDVNYLDAIYKHKYVALWESVQIGNTKECWELKPIPGKTKKRICLPSYRSGYSKQTSENVTLQKAVYQCAWGDVGTLSVTRTCGNPNCLNPLHLISAFNRSFPPQTISPFDVEFKPEKLIRFAQHQKRGTLHLLLKSQYKLSISNPKFTKELQE